MELANVLIAPVVTEKSAQAQQLGKYTFLVRPSANKILVSKAVEMAYGVKVKAVNMIPVRQKARIVARGRTVRKRSASLKAVVTLHPKQTLDFNKVKTSK